MAIKFNPLTGNFDFTGSGGGGGGSAFFAGEVATYADLPLDGTAALNSRWLVRSNSGTWPFSTYKQAGIYIRIDTVGSDRDDDYQLTDTSFHDVMSDDAFLIFDNTDPTKAAKFDVGTNVPTSSTVTLTVPASSGTIARTETFAAPPAIGSTTPAAGTFTTLTANGTGSALVATFGTATAGVNQEIEIWGNAAGRNHFIRASAGSGVDFRMTSGGAAHCGLIASGALTGFRVSSTSAFGWSSAGNSLAGTQDTLIFRDAADTVAQRRDANAQEFRVYGTFTSSTNYQRLTIKTRAVTLSGLTGASVATTTGLIPDGAVLVGLTTRVSTAITGATGYDIGDGSDADRWGANIGFALNTASDNRDWTATTIQCFTAAQEVTLTAVGGNFTDGAVQIVAHYLAGEAD